MTVVIVSASHVPWVAATATLLRTRGLRVIEIERSMTVVASLLLTERVVAVLVDRASAPHDWKLTVETMIEIAPAVRISLVDADVDPDNLVAAILPVSR